MKLEKMIAFLSIILVLVLGSSQIIVEASESINGNPISKVLECEYLTKEAKQTIVAMCSGADEITLYIPQSDSARKSDLDSGSGEQAYILISKTISTKKINGVNYEDKEETLVALSTLNGNISASGQTYGVAASNVVSITWTYSDPTLSDLKVKFNSMTAKYTYLPTQSTEVVKMDYSIKLEQTQFGEYLYNESSSEVYPRSGVSYSKTLNSPYFKFGGEKIVAMIKITYSNGSSSEYEGTPNHP